MSEFVEISEKSGEMKLINCGHGDGELWGLAVHPTTDKFVTASADNNVRLWDITAKVNTNFSPLKFYLFIYLFRFKRCNQCTIKILSVIAWIQELEGSYHLN